jgi:hypothetical protein
MPEATIKDIMAFFGMTASQFSREWKLMTDTDKIQLKAGLTDGSLTY